MTTRIDTWLAEPETRDALRVLRERAVDLDVELLISRAGVDVRPMTKIVTTISATYHHDHDNFNENALKLGGDKNCHHDRVK
jgi:flavoprotein